MQINQYTNTASSITNDDWMDLDKQTSPGVWQSQKLSLSTLADGMIDLFPELTENIYTTDGALPTGATRTFDLDTGKINLLDGNMNVGGTGIVGGVFRIEVTGSPSGIIVFSTGTAGQFSGDIAAMQLFSGAVGLFSAAQRNVMRDDATLIPTADPSCILELISTSKGFLIPRMTEVQMNSIPSPTTSLQVYNTDRQEIMYYHSTFGWIGNFINMSMSCGATTAVTSTTYYFGAYGGIALRTSISGLGSKPTKKCSIIGASFTRFISGVLGDRSYTLYVRVNNTTDYLVATVATTSVESFFINSIMNIPIDPSTDSFAMKLVVSGGTTDSTNVLFAGNLLMG